MPEYVSDPIIVDPDELALEAFDYLRSNIAGWEPADGNLDVWLIESIAQIAAQVAETAADVPEAIFRTWGEKLVGVVAGEAAPATGTATFALIDTIGGYKIPAGTAIALRAAGGDLVVFSTFAEATVPVDAATIDVAVVAQEPGVAANGLSGLADLGDPLDFVQSVTLTAATSGGTDAEAQDVYDDRLADELRLLAPRPILAADFATLAKRVSGVARATAIDNYIPAGPGDVPPAQTNAERAVTVVLADATGEPVGPGAFAEVEALLEASREVNFVVSVLDPTHVTIAVAFTATAWPGFDTEAVEANAVEALKAYLSPANWGQPNVGDQRAWVNEPVVRYLEVAQVLNSVEGLRYIGTLTINGTSADVTMTGVAPLPRAGTITGAVS